MKHSRIFSIVLLIAIIGGVVAVFACKNLEAIRDAAQIVFNAEGNVRGKTLLSALRIRNPQLTKELICS